LATPPSAASYLKKSVANQSNDFENPTPVRKIYNSL